MRDRLDRTVWRTERGPLSVTGTKFFNWHLNQGGGGAIDLVMHLGEMDVVAAVHWLENRLGPELVQASSSSAHSRASCSGQRARTKVRQLRLPAANLANLDQVVRYLSEQRCLAAHILEPLIKAGSIYADGHGNAVFLMVAGKSNRSIGAELRGTSGRVWRGLAAGTRKDAGYFWIGEPDPQTIVLCESAIDAISCFQLHRSQRCRRCIYISAAGVRPAPHWLHTLLSRGYEIYCGFDDDEPGNAASLRMLARHSTIKRLRPPAHDWNDALRGR